MHAQAAAFFFSTHAQTRVTPSLTNKAPTGDQSLVSVEREMAHH